MNLNLKQSKCERAQVNALLKPLHGFTLIEVMIALFVLVMIGTLTAKSVVEAAKLKQTLALETEFSSELRTSLMFIERDLNQVFNPRWTLSADAKPLDPYTPPTVTPPTESASGRPAAISIDELNRRLKSTAFQAFEYWGPVLDLTGVRASRFKGDESKMSFVTSSHVRVYQQKKESIYSKVKYEVIKDTLYKTENTHAFEMEEPRDIPYETTYVILKHIKSLKFKYVKLGEKELLREWDSEATDGRPTKGIFPEAVEMEMELEAPEGRSYSSKVLFKLETPNDVLPRTY